MPETFDPPPGFDAWIMDASQGYVSDADWGTDADLLGDALAGVDSVRLLGANRVAIVTKPMTCITGKPQYIEAWLKTSSLAANTEIKLAVGTSASLSETPADYDGGTTLRNAACDFVDTWQCVSSWFTPLGSEQSMRVKIIKGSASYTVTVAAINVWDAPPATSSFGVGSPVTGSGLIEIFAGHFAIRSGTVFLDGTDRLRIRGAVGATGTATSKAGRLRVID
jgi:hypothetical protein